MDNAPADNELDEIDIYTPCKCDAMWNRVLEGANAHKKGLVPVVLTHLKTFCQRMVGIAYKTNASDRGIMLNFCPWCGQRILDSTKKKKNEEESGGKDINDKDTNDKAPTSVGLFGAGWLH